MAHPIHPGTLAMWKAVRDAGPQGLPLWQVLAADTSKRKLQALESSLRHLAQRGYVRFVGTKNHVGTWHLGPTEPPAAWFEQHDAAPCPEQRPAVNSVWALASMGGSA